MFIGRNEFKEDIDGRFRKTLEIERMIKITPDEKFELIDKYKNQGSDQYGKEVFNNVQQRRINTKKYNL